MSQDYEDEAAFLMVYVREAHASDEWQTKGNERAGIVIAQPTTYAERREVAAQCGAALEPAFPVVVDTIDDVANKLYGAWPERLYVIDAEGYVHYQGGYGPWGFKPDEAEEALRELL